MTKETKILTIATIVVFILMGVFAYFLAITNQPINASQIQGVEVDPEEYNLGEVQREAGLVTREYEVKNTTEVDLKLTKITTSCMCTLASLKVGDEKTNFYGMEHGGNRNPRINFDLPAGETGILTVEFDPDAHGPQGVGQFDRVVWLHFAEGIQQISFKGEVVN